MRSFLTFRRFGQLLISYHLAQPRPSCARGIPLLDDADLDRKKAERRGGVADRWLMPRSFPTAVC
jgi:hypothetical protein